VSDEGPEEELVEVGARRVPVGAWEAEVMIRAVAWICIVRGVELGVAYVPYFLDMWGRTPGSSSVVIQVMSSMAGWLAFGVVAWSAALVWSGALLFWRSARSRTIVLVLTAVGFLDQFYYGTIPSLGRLGRPSGLGRASLGHPLMLAIVATVTLVSLFTVLALVHRPGREALQPAQTAPLAPLSSVWRLRRGLRGWLSLGFLLGALVLAARTVWIRIL